MSRILWWQLSGMPPFSFHCRTCAYFTIIFLENFSISLHAVDCRCDRAVNLLNNHSIGSQGSAWHAEGLSRGDSAIKTDTRTAPGTGRAHNIQVTQKDSGSSPSSSTRYYMI